jgi:uncharacterized repeat protein (TIGR03847 family)
MRKEEPMAKFTYDLNPVQHIIADATGEPGKRTFFLQARAGSQLLSLVMEKQQVANLAISVLQMLEELAEKKPDLPPMVAKKKALFAESPVEPFFRVGQLMVGYDEEDDKIWVIAKALIVNESGAIVDPDDDDVPAVRFVATREQMRALSEHALEVISKGRPTCPLCGRPIDREGHFCPRSDGEAMPIIF